MILLQDLSLLSEGMVEAALVQYSSKAGKVDIQEFINFVRGEGSFTMYVYMHVYMYVYMYVCMYLYRKYINLIAYIHLMHTNIHVLHMFNDIYVIHT